jgi:hypothetical protein
MTADVILAFVFIHVTVFSAALAVMLSAIAFAQPKNSAANLKAVTEAMRKTAEETMSKEMAGLVQRAREEAIGTEADEFLRRRKP